MKFFLAVKFRVLRVDKLRDSFAANATQGFRLALALSSSPCWRRLGRSMVAQKRSQAHQVVLLRHAISGFCAYVFSNCDFRVYVGTNEHWICYLFQRATGWYGGIRARAVAVIHVLLVRPKIPMAVPPCARKLYRIPPY